MAERMTAMALASMLSLAVAWHSRAADAQPGLADPTRPPNAQPARAGDGGPGSDGASPRLQSILISPQRRLAVIDGRTVPLGGKVDDAVLVQIAETHVVLRQGSETKTLELTPGINKKKGPR